MCDVWCGNDVVGDSVVIVDVGDSVVDDNVVDGDDAGDVLGNNDAASLPVACGKTLVCVAVAHPPHFLGHRDSTKSLWEPLLVQISATRSHTGSSTHVGDGDRRADTPRPPRWKHTTTPCLFRFLFQSFRSYKWVDLKIMLMQYLLRIRLVMLCLCETAIVYLYKRITYFI